MKRVSLSLLALALASATAFAAEDEPLLGGGITEIIEKGGIVMVCILVGSVVGLALALERLVSLRRTTLVPKELIFGDQVVAG